MKANAIGMGLIVASLASGAYLATAAEETQKDAKTQLKEGLADKELVQELREPDGAAIMPGQDENDWKIYARGTGTYDFNDPDDIQDATKEAVLQAKANLAKFLSEKIQHDLVFNSITEKRKKLVTGEDPQVSKDIVKKTVDNIRSSSEAILQGVVTLESEKIPGAKNSGTVEVKIGVSKKTLRIAKIVKGDMAAPTAGEMSKGKSGGSETPGENKGEVRKSKTDF